MNPACPVCLDPATVDFMAVSARQYWRCQSCLATFLDPDQRPDHSTEQTEYDLHRNEIQDPAYRRFLLPAVNALDERCPRGASILDYGCGPGPALAEMLRERGHALSLYDPIYRPDSGLLQRSYDAVSCTEVVEHFHRPAQEFARLDDLLRPGGWLVILTRFQTDDARFAAWHYRRDPTHVVFYRPQTFRVLAEHHGWRLTCTPPNLVLVQKL